VSSVLKNIDVFIAMPSICMAAINIMGSAS
jgi:hypothetical protein